MMIQGYPQRVQIQQPTAELLFSFIIEISYDLSEMWFFSHNFYNIIHKCLQKSFKDKKDQKTFKVVVKVAFLVDNPLVKELAFLFLKYD